MTMRDHHDVEPTTTMDPVATDIGSGAPPQYAGRETDVDLRGGRERDERMPPARRVDPRYDERDAPRFDAPPVRRTGGRRYVDDDGGDGPGFADEAARFARRHLRTPETKEFFKTSELAFVLLGTIMLMLAASVHETFDAEHMWPLVTVLFAAYILSRGVAKAGVRHHDRGERYEGSMR